MPSALANPLPPDPYTLLGVAKDAKLPEIRSAHRKMVLRCHPDKVQDAALKAVKQDEFQKVQQAYELLSDDSRRLQYDEQVKLWELRKGRTKTSRAILRKKSADNMIL
jgi:curved DNA-binding protein CbpA